MDINTTGRRGGLRYGLLQGLITYKFPPISTYPTEPS